jgi:membrane associated rhomboid family serine protease
MGFEDRQYYQSQESYNPFSLDRNSIVAILIMINVAIFLVDSFTSKVALPTEVQKKLEAVKDPNEREAIERQLGSRMQTLAYHLGIRYEHPWFIWNYLTYGFAHSSLSTETSFWHLLGNMLMLFFLGRAVEEALGRQEFLKFYLIAIVACGIGFTLIRFALGSEFNCLVGASGGTSAVAALFIFMFPQVTLYLFGVLPMPAWVLGLILLVQNLIVALNPNSNTAWEAHLVGFAFGAAYFFGKWDFSKLPSVKLSKLGKARPKLRIHDPDQGFSELQAEADLILKKINELGEDSLTRRERNTLTSYSQQLRDRRK